MKNLSNFRRLAVLVFFIGITVPCLALTNYYSNSTGNLDQLSSWGTNTTGTGTAPTSFTANGQVFNIVNNANPTIGANWTVSGTGSYIVVGNGINFQNPSNYKCTGTIDVSAGGTLSIANTTNPTLGTLNASSTVVFNGSAVQTIPVSTYGNLIFDNSYAYTGSGAVSSMAGSCTISGTFSVTNGTLSLDNSASASYTFTVDSLNVSTSGTLYFGGTYYTGGAMPAPAASR